MTPDRTGSGLPRVVAIILVLLLGFPPSAGACWPGWHRIAWCESTNNPKANTGNGYYGWLQMDMKYWHTAGKGHPHIARYARPDLAPRWVQAQAAENRSGHHRNLGAWPHCKEQA